MKALYFKLISFIKLFLQYVFLFVLGPNECIICGNFCGIFYLCKECEKKYFDSKRIFLFNRCPTCGKELLVTQNQCLECREKVVCPNADSIFCLYSYRLWNKELMFLWKSKEIRALSFFFAGKLQLVLKAFGVKVIVPVPPRPGKILEKGWDQIDELCSILEYFYHYKILRILQRNTKEQQKKLNKENRIGTIGKGYTSASTKVIAEELKKNKLDIPKEVCLLDDVCTTGATIESCCEILKNIGIAKIQVVTLFKVD